MKKDNSPVNNLFTAAVTLIALVFSMNSHSMPVISIYKNSNPDRHFWGKLTEDQFRADIEFHIQRVSRIALFVGTQLGVTNLKTLEHMALAHDRAKLLPELLPELYSRYQSKVDNPAEDRLILDLNRKDNAITEREMKRIGLIGPSGVSHPQAPLIMLSIEIADKLDRELFPKTLARTMFNTRRTDIVSPEFLKVMQPLENYSSLDDIVRMHLFFDVAAVERAIDLTRKNYQKWMALENLLPAHLYHPTCKKLFTL